MSISKRVKAALDAMKGDDPEQALHDICSAIEQTAKQESGGKGARTYKDFIRDNFTLISRSSFGVEGSMGQLQVAYSHPQITPDADGLVGFEAIVYHVVRCGLYHSTELPVSLRFQKGKVIHADGGSSLVLPSELVNGLIMAVVASPSNANESLDPHYRMEIQFVGLVVNNVWGKRDQLNALFDSMVNLISAVRPFERH
jgi:hypothetical protein